MLKFGAALLLQASSLFVHGLASSLPRRGRLCSPKCSDADSLVRLLKSDDNFSEALSFCSEYLGLATPVEEVTVTPTVVEAVTITDYVTIVETSIDSVTVTVTVEKQQQQRRDSLVPYPNWLPESYPASRVTSACRCLEIPVSTITTTATADALTLTTSLVVTVTELSTELLTATATATVVTEPLVTLKNYAIEVLREDNGQSIGYIYNSNGPAIGQLSQATRFDLSQPLTAKYSEKNTISLSNSPTTFFSVKSTESYGSFVWSENVKLDVTSSAREKTGSDVWTYNTETREFGVQWLSADGSIIPVTLWRLGGRAYTVIDEAYFLRVTGGSPGQKDKIKFVQKDL